MKEEVTNQQAKNRPFFLLVLCIISFTYNGILSTVFITLMFFPAYIQKTLNTYFTDIRFSIAGTYAFLASGFLLFLITLTGIAKIWALKKTGFYIYLFTKMILIIILLFSGYHSLVNIGISVFLIIFYWSYLNKMS